jgi:hypothetical protein
MRLSLPRWYMRKVVRRHPWLLAETGTVSVPVTINLIIVNISFAWRMSLDDKTRGWLIAERDAGTLFGKAKF